MMKEIDLQMWKWWDDGRNMTACEHCVGRNFDFMEGCVRVAYSVALQSFAAYRTNTTIMLEGANLFKMKKSPGG